MTKFRTGQRVVDIETGEEGRVIFQFSDPELDHDFVVVRLDYDPSFAVAFPPGDLRHASH